MKLSNKGRYAIRALFDIAFFSDGRPTQVKDIAERQGIPARFLEQIFQDLKRGGIVGSKRGPQGGYILSRGPTEISIGDVVRAVEGPITLGDRAEPRGKRGTGKEARQVLDAVFTDLASKVEASLNSVSIDDVCQRADSLGLSRPSAERYVYVI